MYKIKKVERQNRRQENAYRKKRKEKKSKGLFYLIFTLTIIAALTISCKNKPTGSNEFAWEDVDIKVSQSEIKKEDWKGLLGGKTIISESTLPAAENDSYGISYFWGEFTDDGFKWGTSTSHTTPPAYNRGTVSLNANFLKNNEANFTGQDYSGKSQTATIKFEFESDTTTIKNVTVTFTDGVYPALKNKPIQCGKPKEKN